MADPYRLENLIGTDPAAASPLQDLIEKSQQAQDEAASPSPDPYTLENKALAAPDSPLGNLINQSQKQETPQKGGIGALIAVPIRMAAERISGTDVGPEPSGYTAAVRPSAVAVGATVGAIAGSKLPVAPGYAGLVINPLSGALAGGEAGAFAGTYFPETTLKVAEWAGLVPEGTTEANGRKDEELYKMALGEAALDGWFGLVGQSVRFGLGRPMARALTGAGTPEAEDLARFAKTKLNVDLLPLQTGERGAGKAVYSVFGKFPFIGAPARGPVFLQRYRYTKGVSDIGEQARTAVKEIPIQVGDVQNFPDLSHAMLGDAHNLLTAAQKNFSARYTQVYELATKNGIRVTPTETKKAILGVLKELDRTNPLQESVDAAGQTINRPYLAGTQRKLEEFLLGGNGMKMADEQTLMGMDGAMTNLDDFVKGLEPAQQRRVLGNLNTIRNAMIKDMQNSVYSVQPGRSPQAAQNVAAQLRQIDQDYSAFLSNTFDLATAKKFGKVEKYGVRGVTYQPNTGVVADKLAKTLLDLESPQAIREIKKLVTPETAKSLAASVLEDGFQRSFEKVPGSRRVTFNVDRARKAFGFTEGLSGKGAAMKELLDGTGIDMETLDKTLKVFEAMASFDAGDASQFVVRRTVMGGKQAALSAITGGTIRTAGAAAAAGGAAYLAGLPATTAAVALSVLGPRGLVRAMANPAGARAWREAISDEAGLGARRTAVLSLIRTGIQEITRDSNNGEWLRNPRTGQEFDPSGTFDKVRTGVNQLFQDLAEEAALSKKPGYGPKRMSPIPSATPVAQPSYTPAPLPSLDSPFTPSLDPNSEHAINPFGP